MFEEEKFVYTYSALKEDEKNKKEELSKEEVELIKKIKKEYIESNNKTKEKE